MATLIVPKIADAPNLVPIPIINDQLPTISDAAARYERVTGKGKWRGRTKASAKLFISFNFSKPWCIRSAPVNTLKKRSAKSFKMDLYKIELSNLTHDNLETLIA